MLPSPWRSRASPSTWHGWRNYTAAWGHPFCRNHARNPELGGLPLDPTNRRAERSTSFRLWVTRDGLVSQLVLVPSRVGTAVGSPDRPDALRMATSRSRRESRRRSFSAMGRAARSRRRLRLSARIFWRSGLTCRGTGRRIWFMPWRGRTCRPSPESVRIPRRWLPRIAAAEPCPELASTRGAKAFAFAPHMADEHGLCEFNIRIGNWCQPCCRGPGRGETFAGCAGALPNTASVFSPRSMSAGGGLNRRSV
jgi:hypothetical protein